MFRLSGVWTGVAGSPAYHRSYWNGSLDDAQSAVDALEDFITAVAPLQVDGCLFTLDPVAVEVDPQTGNPTDSRTITPFTEGASGGSDVLPRMTSALVQFRTGTFAAGREIQGRWSLPYFAEAQNAPGGVLASASVTALNAALATMLSTSSVALVIWSRKTGFPHAVSTAQVRPAWATMRSRAD